MASSTVQLRIEKWIRPEQLPQVDGQTFRPTGLQLVPDGYSNYEALSANNSIIANISMSSAKTANGKHASGMIINIRAEMFFLVMTLDNKRLIVLTEKKYDQFLGRRKASWTDTAGY